MNFVEKFDKDNKYIFKKERFESYERQRGTRDESIDVSLETWVIKCENREIDIIDEKRGYMCDGVFRAHPQWCEEIIIKGPKLMR